MNQLALIQAALHYGSERSWPLEDLNFYREQEEAAKKQAEQAELPGPRAKFLSAAAAWAGLARRRGRRSLEGSPAPESEEA